MMKSEAGGALKPYMDYIVKLKEENTRLHIIENESKHLKEELLIMGNEISKVHQMELAFDMNQQDTELYGIKEREDRKYYIETTMEKNKEMRIKLGSLRDAKNGYLAELNGYDPESYLKLILTENESLIERKR